MNFGLFANANTTKMQYRRQLQDFDLDGARANLLQAAEQGAPDHPAERAQALESLQKRVQAAAQPAAELALLLHEFSAIPELLPLQPDFFHLREGMRKGIARLLPAAACDFLPGDFHPAEAHLADQRYAPAVESALAYLNQRGEHSLVRQLQGFAHHCAGEEKAARKCLTLALFHDPRQCRAEYLYPEKTAEDFRLLCAGQADPAAAWLELPFVLWREELLPVIPSAAAFIELLQHRCAPETEMPADPLDRRCFALNLLYLAEVYREKQNAARLAEVRRQMEQADADLWQEYRRALEAKERQSFRCGR